MTNVVHISKLNGKLEKFKAISTNTLSNPFCIKMNASKNKNIICTDCYSCTILNRGMYPSLEPALQRNSDLLGSRMLKDEEVPQIMDLYFRFNAHGELINMQHLVNLMLIVNSNPKTMFGLWTKRKDLIKKYFDKHTVPSNLRLIYSNPVKSKIMEVPPKYFHKTFNNVLESEQVERQNCTGQKCKDCLLCYTVNDTTTIIEKVKKY